MNKAKLQNQLKTKKAFIFDMDGTIIDLEELNHKGYAETIKKFFNITLNNDDYQKYFSGTRTAEAFDGFLKSKQINDYDVNKLISDFREGKRYNLKNNPDEVGFLKKGIANFLNSLKQKGYSTCLATSTVKEFVDIILEHFQLKTLFDIVLTADDVTKGKPNPQIYNTAIDRLDITREEAVVFEDSKNGIASAQNAGIFCVGILTKGLNDDYVKNADFVIEDFEEINSILN
jgi:beta-phosphoglucomutase